MNLPNKLTVLRVILVPVFMLFLCVPLGLSDTLVRVIAAVLFALTSLTDMLDGKIARKYNMVTDFGKLMDPLADKFLVFGAMLGILVYCADLRPIFVWAAAIVMLRELAVTSLRLLAASQSGAVIAAAWLGKVKTVTQVVCILCVILEPVILPFPLFTQYHLLSYVTIAAMIVMTIWSGVEYFTAYGKNINMK
ncbi:MAG: CDP-diacylglycerol--glycerol-3-phosphate 3-phosphatidyltransferase [Clostridia bacterium]|jgi:CDP-diacylglycerol--glycerol-3-phosphate 3-phosphatidyltransferase|nr:CDP-diacylglycerol--glycerol-3-phosphate 3-phosphatidyltransferase [Clostridia bacterium]